MPKIKAICVSDKKGPKSLVNSAYIIDNHGIKGDFHASSESDRQISLLSYQHIEYMQNQGFNIKFGDFGENIVFDGIDFYIIKIGAYFKIADKILLKITKIGKSCKNPCIIQKKIGKCIMPQFGIFAKVINGGGIKNEDSITYSE